MERENRTKDRYQGHPSMEGDKDHNWGLESSWPNAYPSSSKPEALPIFPNQPWFCLFLNPSCSYNLPPSCVVLLGYFISLVCINFVAPPKLLPLVSFSKSDRELLNAQKFMLIDRVRLLGKCPMRSCWHCHVCDPFKGDATRQRETILYTIRLNSHQKISQ